MAGPTPTTCLSVWDAGKAPAPHQKLSGAECYKRVRQKSLPDSPCSECLLDLARSTQFVWGFRLMVAGKEVPGPHPPGLVSGWDRHSGGCAHGGQGQTGVAGRGGWRGGTWHACWDGGSRRGRLWKPCWAPQVLVTCMGLQDLRLLPSS